MKKLLLFPILVLMLFSSCTESIVAPTYTDITLTSDKATIEVGTTFTISISTEDKRTINPFTYQISEEGILAETSQDKASITFKAEKKGNITLTVTESVTGALAKIELTVKGKSIPMTPLEPAKGIPWEELVPAKPIRYTDISIKAASLSINEGEEVTLTASATDGRDLNTITWSLGTEGILESPTLTGPSIIFKSLKEGKVRITATEEGSEKTASVEMTITGKAIPDFEGPYSFIVNGLILDKETGEKRAIRETEFLILEVTDLEGNRSFNQLNAYGDGNWDLRSEDGRHPAELDGRDISLIRAYYAPSYEVRDGRLQRKPDYTGRVGKAYNGDNDIIPAIGTIDRKNGTITLELECDHSLLLIETRPQTRIRVNITGFTSADDNFNENGSNMYSETILTGDGRVEIYGSWGELSEIQVIYAQYGKLHEVKGGMPQYSEDMAGTITIELPLPELVIETPYVQAMNFSNQDLRNGISYFPGQISQEGYNLCWAASSSTVLNWWAWQNSINMEGSITPDTAPYPIDASDFYSYTERTEKIFNFFKSNFKNQGFDPILAMRWFLAGEITPQVMNNLNNESSHNGFFRSTSGITDLVWDFSENYDNPHWTGNDEVLLERYRNVSREIYGILSEGNPIIIQNHNHAFNIWGAEFDTESGLVIKLWVSNSNGGYIENFNPYGIGELSVGILDGNIVLNTIHKDQGDGIVHAPENDPLTELATVIRNFGDIRYITN